jgi:hypothetical protein
VACNYDHAGHLVFDWQGQIIDTHDYVFWCGDLNYRIELPTSLAKDHITNRRWDRMSKHDQLHRQKKLHKVGVVSMKV